MRIRLTHRGDLLSGQKAKLSHIHKIRRQFHYQLQTCWKTHPALNSKYLRRDPAPAELSILQTRGPFVFAPLVCYKQHLHATLEILFLRAANPGNLLPAGDIDNRIKTLIDALRAPTLSEINSADLQPNEHEDPFFCLLEDDLLVTGLSVDTDYFLAANDTHECLLIITVEMTTPVVTSSNINLV